MKLSFAALITATLLSLNCISQTQNSLNLDQELSFASGIGINLVNAYIGVFDNSKYTVVKTGINYIEDNGMTSISINYWGYYDSWETVVGWYVYGGNFYLPNAYTTGIAKHSHVILFVDNGKISIAVPNNAFSLYGSISVKKNVSGIYFNTDWAKNWKILPNQAQPIGGTAKTVQIAPNNSTKNFAEQNLTFNGNRNHNLSNNNLSLMGGKIGIGSVNPLGKLTVNATSSDGTVPEYGISSLLDANLNTNQYGVYSELNTTSTSGNKYGLYSKVPGGGTTGNVWSAYFKGKTEVEGDLIVGRNGTKYIFYSGFGTDKPLFIAPNTTTGDDWNWGVQLEFKKDGELIKTMNNPSKRAFGVITSLGEKVFQVMGNGNVWATQINVALTGFPDYVFDKNYKLMELSEVENYISKNHHLPNMPSATEVESKGADLGELTRLQQEKIEELTLYIIEMNKRLEQLEKVAK